MAKDTDIRSRMNRIEEIIDQLDADEVSLDEGSELYEEGQELLTEIRERLHEGQGEVIEIK
ncbi:MULTISPECIES: exodeoxyribonuclease VII small subunit [Halobacteriales]|jgi:exodeoxyribonuclease VII small subunit|uniref:Exodeoxyribonuclease VII small subunit n=4 Tax=Halobacteriales TaxID=2235 RepID=Q5V754_HALMA|nr:MULTISPECIES: exodeoxyribonuclease VII small subunit [Halobacteria]AAV44645.1 exonuclease VII small subunit [Haloarcula marismortui ATCC 43049]KAB7513605.1 exodeoxyribonuclease VII small subunit [Halosegnis rubeus]QCP89519.1 exodeoxyribonuclease VII small subunit [Haloarcula marismortui ATCC 43049]QZY04721.1 exodeoxyribonuclease VII small subunit [Halobaculum roseum]